LIQTPEDHALESFRIWVWYQKIECCWIKASFLPLFDGNLWGISVYPIFGQTYRFLYVCSQHSQPPARTAQPWSSAAPPVKNRVWNGKPTMLEAMSKGVGEFQKYKTT
jgi:hypothetical protein